MNLDALVAPLRADVVSGAAVVARTAAEVVRRAAGRVPAGDVSELRSSLGTLFVKILDAQPAMAPLVALARDVLDALEGETSLDDGRRAAAGAAEAFRASLEEHTLEAGRRAAERLPERGTVLTLSSSSSVRAALRARHDRGGSFRVICLESRPMNEGRMIAQALAKEGIPVLFAVDAACDCLLPAADVVLLGADSIGDRGVVNKIGSGTVVRAAGRLGIPVLVTADRTKLLPRGFPQPVDDDRPPEEVWKAPSGVRVWNRYFEVLPIGDATSIVTDSAVLSPEDVAREREKIAAPPELEAWAARQGGRPEPPPGEEPGRGSGV